MTATADHEAFVASRFDALRDRFAAWVAPDDYRLTAILRALADDHGREFGGAAKFIPCPAPTTSSLPESGRPQPPDQVQSSGEGGRASNSWPCSEERWTAEKLDDSGLVHEFEGKAREYSTRRPRAKDRLGPFSGFGILDLGCGKGRFAQRFAEMGAEVVGLDVSTGMLAEAAGIDRVLGGAARLPFKSGTFHAAYAIEVFQHLAPGAIASALPELRRVLRPGGLLAILDRNAGALDARRPWLPRAVVKRIDEHRGCWMYRHGEPARERWFRPGQMRREMSDYFEETRVEFLLAPDEAGRAVFRRIPAMRSMVLWTGRAGGTSP